MKTMQANKLNIKPLILALFAAGVLTACGGGGGGDPVVDSGGGGGSGGGGTGGGGTGGGGTGGGGTQAPSLTMSCPDGTAPEHQCSGDTVLQTDNGVMLTRSGVQVFGISLSDLRTPAPTPSNPTGFGLPSASTTPVDGVAEVRLLKNPADNAVSRVGLLLNGFGLSWDATNPRPPIIETFQTAQARTRLDADRKLVIEALPTDPAFYNFVPGGGPEIQLHYANNTYFAGTPINNNPTSDWRTGGTRGNWAEVGRNHEDGDIAAPTPPSPGTKGYRGFTNIAYEFANLSAWNSQDTVLIGDWNPAPQNEHNKERRGLVAFGDVTPPDAVPTTGTATYTGTVYGLLGLGESQDDPEPFVGRATVTVDYAAGTATIAIDDTETNAEPALPVPAEFSATASRGTLTTNGTSTNTPNYFTGAVSGTGVTGGVSGRYFGPDAKEVGGTFQLDGPDGSAILGGFIARKP